MKFVELNHVLEDGMRVYPGMPNPKIGAWMDHAATRPRYDYKAEFYLGQVEMVGNVGTYIDSPFHRFAAREDLSQLPLEKVAGLPGLVLDGVPAADRAITLDCAETDLQESLRFAQLGAALVSNSAEFGESVMRKALASIENDFYLRIHDSQITSERFD